MKSTIEKTRVILEQFLKNMIKPTYAPDILFFGIPVKGCIELQLHMYTIVRRTGSEDEVYHKGRMISPSEDIVFDYPNNYKDRVYFSDVDDDNDQDYTACTLDDCGYCGQCLY